MTIKKEVIMAFLAMLTLTGANAETLAWKANAGQRYETRVTVSESVTGLDLVTKKPDSVTEASPLQEESAQRQSTIPHLSHLITFARGSIEAGSSWTGEVEVLYDLSGFGLKDTLAVKVPATYTFVGMTEIDGRSYHHIIAKWVPLYILPAKDAKRSNVRRLSGVSTLDLLWDNRSGAPKRDTVVEELQYLFVDGTSLLHTRQTDEVFSTVNEIARKGIVTKLEEQIRTQKVENVGVKQNDQGVVLSIEDIQFEADSSVLTAAEKKKILNIGKVLSSLAGRKLSVVGHAANAPGSDEAELLKLSTERAEAVARFIVESGIKAADEVMASGKGGSEPIASNDTAAGRSRNRRVEIIILDEEAAQ